MKSENVFDFIGEITKIETARIKNDFKLANLNSKQNFRTLTNSAESVYLKAGDLELRC